MSQLAPVLRRNVALSIAFLMLLFLQSGLGQTVNVLTQHNDLSRDGANPMETILTTSNVNESSFGKAFSLPVDGFVFAQPLYVSGVTIPGQGTHNVLYVATAHDSVYAFDADSGIQYWQVSLGTAVPSSVIGTQNIQVEVGIISTPVIDPTSGTLYATAKTYENNTQIYRLHALDITTGAEKFGGPTVIAASMSGSAPDGTGGIVTFVASQQLQRPSVTLANGVVYLAFGSHEDNPPYHGWVLGYDAKTLQQVQVFNDTPNSGQGSIWMGGQGLVADASNNLYLITANSSLSSGPGTGDLAAGDYGESFLKLVPNGNSLTVGDYFKPNDFDYLNAQDDDLGSGGAFAIPGTTYIAGGGKLGRVYLVDTTKMGGLNMTANQMVQVFQGESNGLFGSPAFFNNTMYVWGVNEPLRAFKFASGLFNTTPSSQSAYSSPTGETSGGVSVSSNGTTAGTAIVWATTPTGDPDGATVGGELFAFDASNVTNPLWSTTLNESRDGFGNYAKWVPPTIANGRVYVATDSGQISVYGLLSGSVALSNLTHTYSGSPQAATATTTPSGLTVILTYTGTGGTTYGPSVTAPTAAGTYEVAANISNTTYTGTATGTFVINQAAATLTLGSLSQTYTGSPLSASVTTTPSGVSVALTYTGTGGTTYGPTTTPPTNAGSYTVAATVSNPNYTGNANGTLVIGKAAATVTLGNLAQVYSGLPLSATAQTTPAGLAVTFTYTGTGATTYGPSSTPPSLAGSYTVAATVNDPNGTGSANGTLVISFGVLTQHNDLTRDGADPYETILTTSDVNVSSFGKVFSMPVDGYVLAQPLYVPGVAIPGKGTHNIVYVATEHDSVYAFDADSGTQYWQVSLGTSVPSPPDLDLSTPVEVGITSTPVIDAVSGTIYVAPLTSENGQQVYRLHALDITTGAEKFGGPVQITASVSGSAPDGSGGVVTFDASGQLQRTAVTLVNGVVYLAFSAYNEDGDTSYHGWVLGYDASTLQQLQVFNDTPNGEEGGIWMGGQGFVADSSNNLYLVTGNSVNATENLTGDYGESALKLVPNGNSLTVGDYFKPYYYDFLNATDTDLGAGGAFAIPGTTYLAFASKQGAGYLVDSTNMTGLNTDHDHVLQEWAVDNGQWGSPAFFNNNMYIWGVNQPLLAYQFKSNHFVTTPTSQSAYSTPPGQTNGAVSVSSNGTTPGTAIVWATAPTTGDPSNSTQGGDLFAFDASNLANLIWSTQQNPSRDGFGGFAKFAAPTIANGRVYVPTNDSPGQIAVYGLFSGGVTLSNLTQTYSGSPLPVTVTTYPSGLTVNVTYTGMNGTTYGPSANAPAGAGTYQVVGTISDPKYTGTATETLVINQVKQTITFTPPTSPVNYGVSPITLSATGGASGNPVTFSIVSGPGSLSGTNDSILTITGTGTIVVAANQAGNTNYTAALQVTHSIVVVQLATLTSPAPNTLLTGSTVVFTWTAGTGVAQYALNLSTVAPGGYDLYASGLITRTSTSVGGLPANGTKIYARLYSVVGGTTLYNDYIYATGSIAQLTSPAPSSLLGKSTQVFTWTAGSGVTQYDLHLSSVAPGGSDIYVSGHITGTSTPVNGLPANGATIYARLYSVIDGITFYNDYTYSTGASAQLTSPAPSSLLTGNTLAFTWSAGTGVTQYSLNLSSISPGGYDLYASGSITRTATSVGGLPTNGTKIYARLYSVIDGTTYYNDYTYATGSLAQLATPAPGSLLGNSAEVFTWSAGTGPTQYALNLSSVAPGGYDLYASGHITGTSTPVHGLPTDGTKIYARLYSVIDGITFYNDYTYFTGSLAQITSPAPSSLLTGNTLAFTWSAGTAVTQYALNLSSVAPGGYDLYASGSITRTATAVGGLPTNGTKIYARLYSVINGVRYYNDYTYATGALAQLTSPAPSSLLGKSTQVFTWSAGTGVSQYDLHLSSIAPGGDDLYVSGHITGTFTPVSGLPTNGVKIYARLYSVIDGITFYNDYTYSTGASAQLTSPAPSSLLTGSTLAFTWSAGTGVTQYALNLSTVAPGGYDLYASGPIKRTATSVGGLPTNGTKIYARLYSVIDGATYYNDYSYATGSLAQLTSPAPSSLLGNSTQVFTWSAGTGVSQYDLHLSSVAPGGDDLYVSGHITGTFAPVSGLPTNGAKIYARLYSVIDGITFYNDYTYATGASAQLTSPAPSSLLTGNTLAFTWSAGTGPTQYAFNLSTVAPGGYDLYASGPITRTATSVGGLPTNGTKIYARLYSVIDGITFYNDYTYATGASAQLTSPAPSSSLANSTEVFTWSAGTGVSQYDLHLSSVAPGAYDLYASGHITGTSTPVHGLPTNGETIFARLYSVIDGITFFNDYSYQAK